MRRMEGKVALVTGAAQGIGQAIAQALAAEGATVVINDVAGKEEQAKKLAKELGGIVALADVSRPDEIMEVREKIMRQLGRTVGILVNNAGITRDRTLRKMVHEEFEMVLQVNLFGTYHCTKAFIEDMASRGWGRVVNLTSVVGQMGNFGQSNYAAAKAAIIGFTKSVAREYAEKGVLVNAVAPGFIDTDMTRAIPEVYRASIKETIPLKRLGTPEEVAQVITFLCASGDYITGQVIGVNGGLYSD